MAEPIDRNEVQALLDAIEQDLTRVRGDAPQMQALRAEVARLRELLGKPEHHHTLGESLRDLRAALDEALEHAMAEGLTVTSYVTQIGRMLGL